VGKWASGQVGKAQVGKAQSSAEGQAGRRAGGQAKKPALDFLCPKIRKHTGPPTVPARPTLNWIDIPVASALNSVRPPRPILLGDRLCDSKRRAATALSDHSPSIARQTDANKAD
jgi:hypothetical protein